METKYKSRYSFNVVPVLFVELKGLAGSWHQLNVSAGHPRDTARLSSFLQVIGYP